MRVEVGQRYLGDGVYIAPTPHSLILTTSDGLKVTNEIHLEPEVIANLVKYLNEIAGLSTT